MTNNDSHEVEPILLFEDFNAFNEHIEMNNKYKELQLNIQSKIYDLQAILLPIELITYTNAESALNDAILDKYKDKNTLNIKANKLIDVLEINVAEILELINSLVQYDDYLETKNISDFSIYANTAEQIERYNYTSILLELLQQYHLVAKMPLDVRFYRALFGNVLRFNEAHNPILSIYFILNGINFR